MGHACEFETSMVLAVRGLYVAEDKRQRTNHGAVGFPEKVTAEKGRAFLNAAVHRTAEVVQGLLRKPLPR
jgi:creatinine amidohydrolase/Fe(II)-dependent formamide hydrolase-like protein